MTSLMRRSTRVLPLTFFVAVLGCTQAPETSAQSAGGQQLPQGHPPVQQGAPTQEGPAAVVLETMNAGGYTYARLRIGEEETWAAGPETTLAVGDTVRLVAPTQMGSFHSSTLDRTFDSILFVQGFRTGTPQGYANSGVVAETMSSGGYTYVRVDSDDRSVWLAGPETEVKVGDSVSWPDGPVMRGFHSSTLDRTFEEIVFVGALRVGG